MGYLIGFLVAAFAGYFKYKKGILNTFFKINIFCKFYLYLGLIWLGTLIGWDKPII